jgi:PAS domain S-box-containing protein
VCVVVIVGVQAFYGGVRGIGLFGSDWAQTYGLKLVLYLFSLLVAGLSFRMVLSERDHEERELRQLLEVVNSSSNPAILIDTSQKFYYVNPAFEGLLGYLLAEIKGQSTYLILPSLDEIDVRDESEDGTSLREEFLRTKKGQLIPVKMDFAPVKISAIGSLAWCVI